MDKSNNQKDERPLSQNKTRQIMALRNKWE